jgi:sigma-B regulation protein RsbU (phosphoserine phosphatase)
VTVLLIDDQAMVAEAVRRMIADEADLDFHACDDPTVALERAADVQPTVILLDLLMPQLDGLTLLKFIRANEATREVPVIVLSSNEEPVTKAEAFGFGASDYIVKLPDPIELLARIRHHSHGYIAQLERNEAFAALERSQRALARELSEAAAYVRSLLPAPLTGPSIETDWRFIPSVQLGGDALGYHWLDDENLAVFLLDVSGHGVKSALLSMTAMNALRTRTLAVDYTNPAEVLSGLNAAFQMDLYDGMYFTIWYGVFNRATRRLVHGNAGHPPGLLVSQRNGEVVVDTVGEPGFIIGMVPDAPFSSLDMQVPPNSNLFLFSDGAYEITRPDGSMWTLDQFAGRLRSGDPAAGLLPLAELEAAIREVRGEDQFEDDVSILQVRFGSER